LYSVAASAATEYNLQRQSCIDAFKDAGIQSAIASFAGGITVLP
jgi:hypothetical protein